MKTTIAFKKTNSDEAIAKYEFYRSTNKEDLYAVENKIGELTQFTGSDTVSFVDQNAQYEVEYYYGCAAVAKNGYTIPSVAKYHCVFKNNAGIAPNFLVGDLQAGLVGVNVVSAESAHMLVVDRFNKIVDALPAQVGVSRNIGGYSPDRIITGYWRGRAAHYLPCPFGQFTVRDTGTWIGQMLTAFNAFHNSLLQDKLIKFEGHLFELDLLTVSEFNAMVSTIDTGCITYSNIREKQPLVPAYMNSNGPSGKGLVLIDDVTKEKKVFKYANGYASEVNANGSAFSGLAHPYITAPFALRAYQY